MWARAILSNNEILSGEEFRAQDRFLAVFSAHGTPESCALFSREGTPRGNVELYLTPDAAKWSEIVLPGHHWETTEAPPAEGTSLLVGNGLPHRLLRP